MVLEKVARTGPAEEKFRSSGHLLDKYIESCRSHPVSWTHGDRGASDNVMAWQIPPAVRQPVPAEDDKSLMASTFSEWRREGKVIKPGA